jgi:hypothetical protein
VIKHYKETETPKSLMLQTPGRGAIRHKKSMKGVDII